MRWVFLIFLHLLECKENKSATEFHFQVLIIHGTIEIFGRRFWHIGEVVWEF